MGISREGRLKRKRSGGQLKPIRKKRKFGMGRPTSNTRLGNERRVRKIRTRGGNQKLRALRLATGTFVWRTQNIMKRVKIVSVLYNAANNEYVRRNLLTKGTVCAIEKTPFEQKYKLKWGALPKDGTMDKEPDVDAIRNVIKTVRPDAGKWCINKPLKRRRQKKNWGCDDEFLRKVFQKKEEPLLAIIRSRPGQFGRAVGYVLEGKELDFYKRKIMERKKGSKAK